MGRRERGMAIGSRVYHTIREALLVPKEIMVRHAADNPYLHRDFHAAMNGGIHYLRETFGLPAVRDYLRQFAHEYYSPLRARLLAGDLGALAQHTREIYAAEEAEAEVMLSENELTIRVPACPAVTHIRKLGQEPDEAFVETTRTVNEAICEGTPFVAELLAYDPETGASQQRFSRRAGR
jgi:hypothetical protein